jgi:hypothetical protein
MGYTALVLVVYFNRDMAWIDREPREINAPVILEPAGGQLISFVSPEDTVTDCATQDPTFTLYVLGITMRVTGVLSGLGAPLISMLAPGGFELMYNLASAGGFWDDESFGTGNAQQKKNPNERTNVLILISILLDQIVVGKVRKENDACEKRVEMGQLSPVRRIRRDITSAITQHRYDN